MAPIVFKVKPGLRLVNGIICDVYFILVLIIQIEILLPHDDAKAISVMAFVMITIIIE